MLILFVIRKNFIYKLLLMLFILLTLVFYDATLPLINGLIQLKINILGFFLEPLLQWAFDVSLRQAQVIAAWIYLLISIFIFGYFLIRISQKLLATIYTARRTWLVLTKWQKAGFIVFLTLLFIAIGKIVLLVI
jgi:hypothetical protein